MDSGALAWVCSHRYLLVDSMNRVSLGHCGAYMQGANTDTCSNCGGTMWDHKNGRAGEVPKCRYMLSKEFCCMEVVRPGKVQCVCDKGLPALLQHHYERGKDDERESHCNDDY